MSNEHNDADVPSSTTSRRRRGKGNTKRKAIGVDDSDEGDEELKRVLELSKHDYVYISDDDDDYKRAISLSLMEANGETSTGASSQGVNKTDGTSEARILDNILDSSLDKEPSSSRMYKQNSDQHASVSISGDSSDSDEEFPDTCNLLLDASVRNGRAMTGGSMNMARSLSSREATARMRNVFEKGIESHLNMDEMEPCKAISTKLHSHQKLALAWMVKQEINESDGMRGGILADDMGLGKTLTMIALILSNFHDQRPLAHPEIGFRRPLIEVIRGGTKRENANTFASGNPESNVGKKLKEGIKNQTQKRSAFGFFSKFNDSIEGTSGVAKQKSFTFTGLSNHAASSVAEMEDDSDFSEDEYDRMIKKSSLSSKLAGKDLDDLFKPVVDPREKEADEVYKQIADLSDKERKIILKEKKFFHASNDSSEDELPDPAMNLDGAFDSDSEEMEPESTQKAERSLNSLSKRRINHQETGEKSKKRKTRLSTENDSDVDLSDIDLEASSSTEISSVTSKNVCEKKSATNLSLRNVGQVPYERRRRATLIVCPTSLISHWCQEIDRHVNPGVDLKVKIHYGSLKAKIAADLKTHDIVITTYGTLASEFKDTLGPLMKVKWLRVVLDEGHMIKNQHTKAAKAANNLDTIRRWVITGTPIQNNLIELWSLVHWLQFGVYANDLPYFKRQIERPCKSRDPRGFERLQVLIDTICLRRTKDDKKSNGEPIVTLPSKKVILREVEFSKAEEISYAIMNNQATEIVAKYNELGKLLRHYAHIFALMTRLRQMCCHRELITDIDWDKDQDLLEKELAQASVENLENKDDSSEEGNALRTLLRNMIKSGITDDCSICLDDLKSPVITPCAHVFCRACIERTLDTLSSNNCPLCRNEVLKSQLLDAAPDDEAADDDDTLLALEDIIVNESSSKVNAAIRELIRIRRDMPSDKVVIVSQFTSFLSILQPLLKQNDFTYTRLDGTMSPIKRAEVIRNFQSPSENSPKVLLLSLKAGGVGLNLTAGNHLLLLDPAWNPASEWQCFDRIHRLGQTKDVFIYKYITKDSIEKKMMEIQERKQELISGAFHMPDEDRRRQRIHDIMSIFNLS